MKTMSLRKYAGATIGALGLAGSARALTSRDALGFIVSGEPSSVADEVVYINNLLSLPNSPLPNSATIDGHTYTKEKSTAGLPAAVSAGSTGVDSPANGSVDVTGFTYLLAKYDGPNGGDLVWYVGNLTGVQTIPTNAFGANDSQYGLSHWELFNPGTPPRVPDGGATMTLLGFSLLCLEAVRRKIKLV